MEIDLNRAAAGGAKGGNGAKSAESVKSAESALGGAEAKGADGAGGGDASGAACEFSGMTISTDAIAQIASKAAQGVGGIVALDAGLSGSVAGAIGKGGKTPGVKISVDKKEITLSINAITAFGAVIPEVAWNLQERVRESVEAHTGISALKVNVLVTGVRAP
jgi:uncharacterized alkaline shock family protein YloU